MNLEELTQSQLILLTILVNFVVSVATGILTVSLLDQAPPVVTQTVNRVVEHTIETVTAAPAAVVASSPAPSTQDLVTSALAADAARFVLMYGSEGTTTPALGVGVYLAKSRAIVTSASIVVPKEIIVEFADGSVAPASLAREGNSIRIFGFSDDAKLPQAAALKLLAPSDLKLGQTALAISKDGNAATGIVSRTEANTVYTTLPVTGPGTAAVDLSGNLIGIMIGSDTPGVYTSANQILDLLTATSTPATP